jgi:zinc protease
VTCERGYSFSFVERRESPIFAPKWVGLLASLPLFLFLSISGGCLSQTSELNSDLPKVPRVQKFDLLNGLRVLLVQANGEPSVIVNLLVKAGSSADPQAKAGAAFLTAQGLFSANQRKSAEQWKDATEDLGVEFKTRLDLDSTVFQAEVPQPNLQAFLGLLSDMVVHASFQPEALGKIKQQVMVPEIVTSDPSRLAEKHLRALIFNRHPYGRPVWGDLESAQTIRCEDLQDFYQAYYLPNNAALVIIGDLSPSRVMDLIREKLGGWTKGQRVEMQYPKLAGKENFSTFLIEKKGQADAAIVFGHLAPSRSNADYYSLEILNLILGDLGPSSRLAQEFQARKITHQVVRSSFEFYKAGGEFKVITFVPAGSVPVALQAILEVIDSLKRTPITESELKAAKTGLGRQYVEILNSHRLIADQAVEMELYSLAGDFLVTFPKKIEQVTTGRVQEVAKTYLNASRAVAVVVGDSQKYKAELFKLGPVELTSNLNLEPNR